MSDSNNISKAYYSHHLSHQGSMGEDNIISFCKKATKECRFKATICECLLRICFSISNNGQIFGKTTFSGKNHSTKCLLSNPHSRFSRRCMLHTSTHISRTFDISMIWPQARTLCCLLSAQILNKFSQYGLSPTSRMKSLLVPMTLNLIVLSLLEERNLFPYVSIWDTFILQSSPFLLLRG